MMTGAGGETEGSAVSPLLVCSDAFKLSAGARGGFRDDCCQGMFARFSSISGLPDLQRQGLSHQAKRSLEH